MTKFLGGQEHLQALKQMCKSYVFGGSVLEAIRSVPQPIAKNGSTDQGQASKANNLTKQIKTSTRDNKYLVLRNVLIEDFKFADIYVLLADCSSCNLRNPGKQKEMIDAMQNWHTYTKKQALEVKRASLRKINEDIRLAEAESSQKEAVDDDSDAEFHKNEEAAK